MRLLCGPVDEGGDAGSLEIAAVVGPALVIGPLRDQGGPRALAGEGAVTMSCWDCDRTSRP